jgi:glycosyltransferase involved in cell wall biosynthesis
VNLAPSTEASAGARPDRRLRIAFCIDNMNVGGTELNAVRLAERLDQARFELRVVCLQMDGPLVARYEAAGVPVDRFPIPSLYAPATARQGMRLAAHLRRHRIDVFHAHDIYSNIFAVPWARLAGAKVIASRRWWEAFPGAHWRMATRVSYRMAHTTLANSPAVAELVHRREGLPFRRIVVVPNFLDRAAFSPPSPEVESALRRELGLEGGPVVGIVANLLPIKDHAALLRAVARIRPARAGLKLVLVGDGECREPLERLAAELGIRDAVVFAGRRPNQPNLHHLFDVSVLCSTSEGLPNSVLEAMAAGRPVVATRVGAVPDAVLDGETGLLVAPGDVDALAGALAELLDDPGRARRMGAAAQSRARQEYSEERAVSTLERLYYRLAGGGDRARVELAGPMGD